LKPDPIRHVRRSRGNPGREILSLRRPTRLAVAGTDTNGDTRQTTVAVHAIFVREQAVKGEPVAWCVELTCVAIPLESRIRSFGTRAEALAFWESLP
jgi:hypothetical protein